MVRRHDQNSLESGSFFQRVVGRIGFSHIGGTHRVRNWNRDARIDCVSIHALRRGGTSTHLWKSEPVRSHGVELDDGEDCAIVLNAIRGSDARDLAAVDAPFAWEPKLGLTGLRVGLLQSDFDRIKGDNKAVYDQAIADLRASGIKQELAELPKFNAGPLRVILNCEAAAAFDDLTSSGGVNQLKGQTVNDWPNSFRVARLIPAVEYIRAQRARTLLMREMDKFMSNWDVLVSPTNSGSLLVTNLTGHPQIVVPCGFPNNNPVGLLFTGGLYQEGIPMRAALIFEQATQWHTMHPKVDWS